MISFLQLLLSRLPAVTTALLVLSTGVIQLSPDGSCNATRTAGKSDRASAAGGVAATSEERSITPPRRRVGHRPLNQQRFPAIAEERRHERGVAGCVSMQASRRPTPAYSTRKLERAEAGGAFAKPLAPGP